MFDKLCHCLPFRDLLDREKFAEALVKAIPKLEKKSKSLSLANSQVLKQRKIKLLDVNSKTRQLSSYTKQVSYLIASLFSYKPLLLL